MTFDYENATCESGWTGDRCTFKLFHDGPHSNEDGPEAGFEVGDPCQRCGEPTSDGNVAEVGAGAAEFETILVHAECMLPGEEVA